MTENKSLKRRVRQRMTKTRERYTSARQHLLAAAKPDPTADEPLHGPTERTLSDWFALLDKWGADAKPHPQIASWLADEHGVPPWWTQDITVRYEKRIGRRVLGQRGATFSATATKTINVSVERAHSGWTDDELRERWLADLELQARPSKSSRAARFDANEGRVVVGFDARGEHKTLVAIEHEKLPDTLTAKRWTAFWRERLSVLKELLEQG